MTSVRKRAPHASTPLVRKVMRANVGHETRIERTLRRALFALGLRYRKDVRPVPSLRCSADVVFPGSRVCVFVDGCFWHGCPRHFDPPKANAAWWVEKIGENVVRDRRQAAALRRQGWRVFRVWEHDFARLDAVVAKIRAAVLARGHGLVKSVECEIEEAHGYAAVTTALSPFRR